LSCRQWQGEDMGAARGLGMVSGGLDSLLAVELMRRAGVEVTGLHFLNGFSPGALRDRVAGGRSAADIAAERKGALEARTGIEVRVIDVSGEFLQVLRDPRFGYGKNINPCIDCRIFLLRRAAAIMESEGFDLVFTGEVLGQRPMSQHMRAMRQVEKESGLAGRLLRPLCARLMPETIPEAEGLVDRGRLLDIQGRSRRRQIALANEWGVEDYPTPAGGCALTDENYARRYLDLVEHGDEPDVEDTVLLSTGRHLRLSPGVKAVVGRNEEENDYIEREWGDGILLTTVDHPGPVVLVQGEADDADIEKAAAVTARYSDGKREESVRVSVRGRGEETVIDAGPAGDDLIDAARV